MSMIRVILPFHLQRLANTDREVRIQVEDPVTLAAILDALENHYPTLRGTIRDHKTNERRDFIRFFACGEDLSHEPQDAQLPEQIVNGDERFMIIGALAGG